MTPIFLDTLDQLAQMQRLSGICDCEPVRYARPAVRAKVLSDEQIVRKAVAAMPFTNPLVADDLLAGHTMHTELPDIVAIWKAAVASVTEQFNRLPAG